MGSILFRARDNYDNSSGGGGDGGDGDGRKTIRIMEIEPKEGGCILNKENC